MFFPSHPHNWFLRFPGDVVNICRLVDGVVAQLVERLVRNEKVRGSTPLGSTSFHPSAAESENCRAVTQ
jgi:hypothetical protein